MQKDPKNIQTQYRLVHDIYLLMDYADTLVFENFKITSSQMNILSLLKPTTGLRLTDVSLAVFRSKSTITRAVDQLEERNLAKRIPDPEDRRAQLVILTEKGLKFRDEVTEKLLISLDERFDVVSENEMQELIHLMTKLRNGLIKQLHDD